MGAKGDGGCLFSSQLVTVIDGKPEPILSDIGQGLVYQVRMEQEHIAQFKERAELIDTVLKNGNKNYLLSQVREEIKVLTKAFPLYADLIKEMEEA